MQVEHSISGRVTGYIYQGYSYTPDKIKHLKLLEIPGSVTGLGPIQAAQADIHGAIEARDYMAYWFNEAGVPSGYLNTDQFLNEEQVAAAKKAWNDTAGAKNGVAVLGNSFKYTPVYLKPEELQFLQVQQFNITQVARMFGVPASLMLTAVEGSSMTYQNVAQEWLAFVRFSMMSYLILIEDALSDFLPGNTRAKFNLEVILRADTTTRYAAHASALAAGWMTIDEVREIEDLPPLGTAVVDPNIGDVTNV
jgi:HK97 family phage portal protein